MKISNSEMGVFKSCRRKYWFEYVEGLKAKFKALALTLGSAYHLGVEMVLKGNPYFADELDATDDLETVDKMIVEIMVDHFETHFTIDCELIEIEQSFKVEITSGIEFIGRMDGLVKIDGEYWILEHKTVASIDSRYWWHIALNDQTSSYIIAAMKMGYQVKGVLYVVIEKCGTKRKLATPPENLRYKNDGGLYANCRLEDETDMEYAGRVLKWYDEKCRIQSRFIVRTPEQILTRQCEIIDVCRDIEAAKNDNSYYANPGSCRTFPCPFESLCVNDSPEIREVKFEPRKPRE